MVIDSETPEEKTFYENLTIAFFGSDPKRIRWSDPEDPPSEETHLSRLDNDATQKARGIFDAILKEKKDATS